jgi:hypothetical protein
VESAKAIYASYLVLTFCASDDPVTLTPTTALGVDSDGVGREHVPQRGDGRWALGMVGPGLWASPRPTLLRSLLTHLPHLKSIVQDTVKQRSTCDGSTTTRVHSGSVKSRTSPHYGYSTSPLVSQ